VTATAANSPSVVLIVEDEEESRETLRELLELEGLVVQTAANGREGLDAIAALGARLCVVLLDLFMPVMDGWQVVDALRREGRLGSVRVVIVTSAAHRAPPGIPVLEKPLDIARLMETIQQTC
jgi:CheY-like chemotaxis protein